MLVAGQPTCDRQTDGENQATGVAVDADNRISREIVLPGLRTETDASRGLYWADGVFGRLPPRASSAAALDLLQ